MYVCLCNGFRCSDVKRVLCENASSCSVAKVYKALDCRPACGKCVPAIRDLICEQKGCLIEGTANDAVPDILQEIAELAA